MKILGVDHGEKRIGLALGDSDSRLASALEIVEHISRPVDAARVAAIARDQGVGLIVLGQSFDEQGEPNAAGRRAARFAEALRAQIETPIILWDESFSTQDARQARLDSGASWSKRRGPVDAWAAVFILQSYLDAHAAK